MWTKFDYGYSMLGPEHFADLAVLYKNAWHNNGQDITFYSRNIFNNNNARTAMPALGGYYTDIEGRTIGLKIAKKW
jgi:hypothetical protein